MSYIYRTFCLKSARNTHTKIDMSSPHPLRCTVLTEEDVTAIEEDPNKSIHHHVLQIGAMPFNFMEDFA